jgi:hypothetical protein
MFDENLEDNTNSKIQDNSCFVKNLLKAKIKLVLNVLYLIFTQTKILYL